MCDSTFKAPKTRVFSQEIVLRILKFLIFFIGILFGSLSSMGQCVVYNGQGNAVNNPVWVSCSGGAYTIYIQSPNALGLITIDWGDGSANTVVNGLVPPAFVSHTYTAAIANYNLVLTDATNGCSINGLVVMEEPVNASIQIPIGGVTQTCAPDDLIFSNSSTDVSSNTEFTWNFGDGSPILVFDSSNAGQIITHTYLQGTVTCVTQVTLTAENYCSFGNPTIASFNPIQIYDIDDALITASNTLLCYPDTVVHFSNTTAKNCVPQGNTAQRFEYWNFGDYWGTGNDSIIDWVPFDPPAKPGYNIAFPGIGTYTIMMADSNQCGADTAFITIQIVDQPIAGLLSDMDSTCTGTPVLFTNTSTGGNQSLINFGDGGGFQGIGATATHNYSTAGNFTIRLVHTLAGGTNSCRDTAEVQIQVFPSPVPSANIAPGGGCDSTLVSFINSSSGGATYFWNFGNGDTSSLQNPPPIYYNTEGQTPVVLFVTSSNGCVATDTAFVEIYDTPVANFTLQNVCEDALATFLDNTTVGYGGPITQWTWSFGDSANSGSSVQNPTFIYVDSGSYVISLIASTPYCTDSTSQSIVVEAKPFASFTSSNVSGCSPLNSTFTNTSSGAASYTWSFGDGSTSTAVSPSHSFIHNSLTDTNFVVRLIAQSAFGCVDTVYDTVYVQGNPVASFTSNAVLDCAPLVVSFTDNSSGAINWLWDFGDATGSSIQNPTKTFDNQTQFITNYTVNLYVTAPNGCMDTTQQIVTVYPEPLFNFSIVPTSGCSPLSVSFPVAVGAVLYDWDFGDGTTSSGPNPVHSFVNNSTNNQVFNVQLVATSPFGCVDSVQGSVTVFPLPNASISSLITEGCSPFTANFVNTSTGGTTYTWDFGNGSIVTTANNTVSSVYTNNTNDTLFYYPKLFAYTPDGCVDSTSIEVAVFKRIEASFSVPSPVCHPFNASFTDLSTNATDWDWDFDNGFFSTQQNPQLFFLNPSANPLIFDVELTVNSLEGCFDDTIVQLIVNPKPNADFIIDDSPACHDEPVTITNNSTQNLVNTWRYGSNAAFVVNNSAVIDTAFLNFNQNPITFPISLYVDNVYGCSDTTQKQMQVYPFVQAQFASIDEGCSPFEVEFNNFSTGGSLFEWSFGDGDNSFLEEPVHVFQNNTSADIINNVILTVTSSFGCEDADTFQILVHPTPISQFTVNPTNQLFPASTVNVNNLTSVGPWVYLWEFGDGDTTSVITPNGHQYETWGTYTITLTVSSEYCEDETTRTITIEPPLPVADFDTLVQACAPVSIQFTNSSLYGVLYLWEFGDGGTSSAQNPFYTYQFPGKYTVRLTVTGPGGDVDSKEIVNAISVNEQALANFVFTPDQVNVPLEPVSFINYSQFAQFYEWDFGDENYSELENPQHTYGSAGQFYPTLIATTDFGCADTFQSQVPVNALVTGVIEIPNAFTPSQFGPGSSIYDPLSFDNKVFFPLLSGVSAENYTLSIFNRWGELLFETHNVYEGWTGYYRGKSCPQDAYVWKIVGEYVNGERFTKVGDVTLIQ